MTQEPEAQRLADVLDLLWLDGQTPRKAAAELRRLEAEIERKAAGIKFLWQECRKQSGQGGKNERRI